MSQNNHHRAPLLELVNAYGAQSVADLLDVTLRSIQNYLSETNPTNPHPNTTRKIHELYAKHKTGEGLKAEKNNNNGAGDEYKDKYIKLLESQIIEKDSLIQQKNNHIAKLEDKISLSVGELQKQAVINRAYLRTALDREDDILSILEKKPITVVQADTDKRLSEHLTGAS